MIPRIYPSIIYNLYISLYNKNTKASKKIANEFHKLIKNGVLDVPILTKINRQKFFCPFSHKLPIYQSLYPLYDRQLPKICKYIQKKLNRDINIIDVGANVGDTVINIGLKEAFYLCIEGNKSYAQYIKSNLKKYNYSLETVFLGDSVQLSPYSIESSNGTGHLIQSTNNSNDIFLITLDNLIDAKYYDKSFDLIKIDTDGFDFKVIRGAKKILQKWHPLLFFEWDKTYCEEQGEDPLSIFPILENLGYSECILFDNFGSLCAILQIKNISILEEYIERPIGNGLPYYYDVLVVNKYSACNANELYKSLNNK